MIWSLKLLTISFMSDYRQPDFYRFNEDSLKLVKFISSKIIKADSILDLGAGSGVIGIELSNMLKPELLTCIEVQRDWDEYLSCNLENILSKEVRSEIIYSSFGELNTDKKYDLIVCNPPYYLPGHGQPSKDIRKNTARSFVVDDWNILLKAISLTLTDQGKAFLVVKNDERILAKVSYPGLEKKLMFDSDLIYIEFTLTEDK